MISNHVSELQSGRLWDISGLLQSSRVLITLFSLETTTNNPAMEKLKTLQNELLHHLLQQDTNTSLDNSINTQMNDSPQRFSGNYPMASMNTPNIRSNLHALTLLNDSEALRAQLITALQPIYVGILDAMVRLSAVRDCLQLNISSLKASSSSITNISSSSTANNSGTINSFAHSNAGTGRKEIYRMYRRFVKAIDIQLGMDISVLSSAMRGTSSGNANISRLSFKIYESMEELDNMMIAAAAAGNNNNAAVVERNGADNRKEPVTGSVKSIANSLSKTLSSPSTPKSVASGSASVNSSRPLTPPKVNPHPLTPPKNAVTGRPSLLTPTTAHAISMSLNSTGYGKNARSGGSGKELLERVKGLVTSAEELFHRMRVYRETIAAITPNLEGYYSDSSSEEDEEEENSVARANRRKNRGLFLSQHIRNPMEEELFEKGMQELLTYKEEMKRKLVTITNSISMEEIDVVVKGSSHSEELLSSRLFDLCSSPRRDDNNSIGVLLLRIKSYALLYSIYTTWPSLHFKIPIVEVDNTSRSVTSDIGLGSPRFTSSTHGIHGSAASAALASTPKVPSALIGTPSSLATSNRGVSQHHLVDLSPVPPPPSVRNTNLSALSPSPPPPQQQSLASSSSTHKQLTSSPANEIYRTISAKELISMYDNFHNIETVLFKDTKLLRNFGFTLLQMRDSKCYSWRELLLAGFPLTEIKPLRLMNTAEGLVGGFELTVNELRKAGYSIEECLKAGFDATALRAGGFNELQLVQSGLFTAFQLKKAGCDIQRFALKALYESTDGAHWKHHDNWCSNKPLSQWYGVTVNGAGNVSKIDLRNNNLNGVLPEALCLLAGLEVLDLYNNHLYGEVPNVYVKLVELKDLWLDGNEFEGTMRKSQLQVILPNCRIRF